MKIPPSLFACIVLLFGAVTCQQVVVVQPGATSNTQGIGSICPGCSTPDSLFWVGSLNTEQIPTFALYRNERLTATVNYLATDPLVANFDAMCLQELWSPDRKQAITSGLSQHFPYSFAAPRFSQDCDFKCNQTVSNALKGCFSDNCFQNTGSIANFFDEGFSCLADRCSDSFSNLDINCQMCLSATPTGGAMGDTINRCTRIGDINTNTAGNCLYLFNGESDNVILSKYPIIESDYLLFSNSPYVATTLLYARLNVNNTPVNFFCTHLLPANLPIVDFHSTNAAQVQELISYVQNRTRSGEVTIVAGDFNNGPQEWTDNYNALTQPFTDTFHTYAGNQCTYCAAGGNSLASSGTGTVADVSQHQSKDSQIDHIFVPKGANVCTAGTGLFATQNIVSVNNGNKHVPLSDHYGVFAAYCLSTNATIPSPLPTAQPTLAPTIIPIASPTIIPIASPTIIPVIVTSVAPTAIPTQAPVVVVNQRTSSAEGLKSSLAVILCAVVASLLASKM